MDFYGFSFNGYHSSELGFIRTSDGDRYNENLGPEFQDKTVQIPGGDGTYFFESLDTKKSFTINIAFDNMSETQLRKLRQVFNGKDVGPLIFDECPYKAYIVKLQSPVQLKYICFDEPARGSQEWIHNHDLVPFNDTVQENKERASHRRVYKGEGTIQFVAYKPYAQAIHKYLSNFVGASDEVLGPIQGQIALENKSEWSEASRMLTSESAYSSALSAWIEPNGTYPYWTIYNPGDLPMGFSLLLSKSAIVSAPIFKIAQHFYSSSGSAVTTDAVSLNLDFSNLTARLSADSANYIQFNTNTQLIEGYYETPNTQSVMSEQIQTRTGTLYNDAIVGGELFKVPPTESNTRWNSVIEVSTPNSSSAPNIYKADRFYLYY